MASASRIAEDTLQDGPLVGAARSVEGAARVGVERVQGAVKRGVEGTTEYVQENPMKAVLIAAGVGALLGYLIAKRR